MSVVLNGVTGAVFLLGVLWVIRVLVARDYARARRILEGTSAVVVVLAVVIGWVERHSAETYAKVWLAALLLAWFVFACSLKILNRRN